MSGLRLVQVDSFFDSIAAHQAKNWLDQEGIPAFVEGANANSALYVGSALAGVKLLVAFEDQERAKCSLGQFHSDSSRLTTWYCGDCKEINEPSFDLCWLCGKNREEVEKPVPGKGDDRMSETAWNDSDEASLRVEDLPQRIDSGNPYQPPLVMLPANPIQKPKLEEQAEAIEKTEETIQRAWRSSVLGLGLVFPIPILQAYSVLLLLSVDRELPISSKSQRQFKMAWSINIILMLAICIVLGVIVYRSA